MNFLGVNVAWDKEGAGRRFVRERKVPYAAGHDKGNKIARLYRIDATPTTFLLDGNGTVAAVAEGRMEIESLMAVLEQVSEEK